MPDAAALDAPAGSLAELKRRACAALAAADGAVAWIERHLIALAIDPHARLPLKAHRDVNGTGIVLHDGALIRVAAEVRLSGPDAPQRITAPGRLTYLRCIKGAGTVALWRVPAAIDAQPARPLGTLPWSAGRSFALDGRVRAWRIVGTGGPIVSLTATILPHAAPAIRQYDARDGRLLKTATLDAGAARAELLLGVLRAGGHPELTPRLAAASRDPAHFLRWSAMREWLRHDRDGALPRLREMAGADPHPDVRGAASRTLANWPGGGGAACPA